MSRIETPLAAALEKLCADPAFRRWFAGAACRQADGRPQPLFHGTDAPDFQIFARTEDFAFHLGALEAAQARLDQWRLAGVETQGFRVIPVICRARNPLRLPDLHTWGTRALADALSDAGLVPPMHKRLFDAADGEELDDLARAALEAAGHDAVIYDNQTERGGESWAVWDARLIKSVFAEAWPLDDPRLLPRRSDRARDLIDLRAFEALRADLDAAARRLRDARETAVLTA